MAINDLSKNSLEDYSDPFAIMSGSNSDRFARQSGGATFDSSLANNPDHQLKTPALGSSEILDSDRNGLNSTVDLMSIYYDTIAFENTVGIVIPTIYSFIIFIGLVGNALVITVVLLNRHMRNSTNMLIVNLALADLLFLLFCVPFTAADYALPIWVFSYSWCQVLQYLQYVTAYASVWTLVLMAFDRFLAVCLPVQSLTLRTVRNTLCVSSAVWVLILVLNAPLLQIYGIHRYYFIMEDRASCTFVAQANRTASEFQVQLHHLSFVTWGYLLPLSITCILYFFMLRRLWWGMPAARLGSRASEESIRAKKKVTWMVSGVITTFAICWAPLNTCFAISALTYRTHTDQWVATKTFVIVQFASQILAYANSCLNPILYAFLSENFRKGFFKICGFLFCCGESKLDFERTNEYHHGGTGGHTTHTTGRLSASEQFAQRLSLSTAGRLFAAATGRRKSQPLNLNKNRESLITEEELMRRGSNQSAGGALLFKNEKRRRSSPATNNVNIYRKEPSLINKSGNSMNGEIVVLSTNDYQQQLQNGKTNFSDKQLISKRVSSTQQRLDAAEQRLLDGNGSEINEANV